MVVHIETTAANQLRKVAKAADRLEQQLLYQYSLVNSIKQLLGRGSKRPIPPRELRKQLSKLFRQFIRSQARSSRRANTLSDALSHLPAKISSRFARIIVKFKETIDTYNAHFTVGLSWENDVLKPLRQRIRYAAHIDQEAFQKVISIFLSLDPNVFSIPNYITKVRAIKSWTNQNQGIVIEDLMDNLYFHFSIDVSSEFVSKVGTKEIVYIADSSYIKQIDEEFLQSGASILSVKTSSPGTIVLLHSVKKEISRGTTVFSKPLVSRAVKDCFTSKKEMTIRPNRSEEVFFANLLQPKTSAGAENFRTEKAKFIQGADLRILVATQNFLDAGKAVIILTNDSDIRNIVSRLRGLNKYKRKWFPVKVLSHYAQKEQILAAA